MVSCSRRRRCLRLCPSCSCSWSCSCRATPLDDADADDGAADDVDDAADDNDDDVRRRDCELELGSSLGTTKPVMSGSEYRL